MRARVLHRYVRDEGAERAEYPAGAVVEASPAELVADGLRRFPHLKTLEQEEAELAAEEEKRQERAAQGIVEFHDPTGDALLLRYAGRKRADLAFEEAWNQATGYVLND